MWCWCFSIVKQRAYATTHIVTLAETYLRFFCSRFFTFFMKCRWHLQCTCRLYEHQDLYLSCFCRAYLHLMVFHYMLLASRTYLPSPQTSSVAFVLHLDRSYLHYRSFHHIILHFTVSMLRRELVANGCNRDPTTYDFRALSPQPPLPPPPTTPGAPQAIRRGAEAEPRWVNDPAVDNFHSLNMNCTSI